MCMFLYFVSQFKRHGHERYAFGESVSYFFGAKTDNDERLVNRVNLRFKTNGILLGLFPNIARVRKLRWVLFGI